MMPVVNFAQSKYYNFNVYEGKNYLYTMNQSNNLVIDSQRLIGNLLIDEKSSKWKKVAYHTGQFLFTAYVGQSISHEEGHRSVLSELGINAQSKPFPDPDGVSTVVGVSNETLINLRDTDLPNYIRLHTGGLESDYSYLKKLDSDFNFNEESYTIMYWDYIMRTIGVGGYFFSLLSPSQINIVEHNTPEIKRDVVGHDLYGMIRHLHRPSMNFYRYTEWEQLTDEEHSYAKRVGLLSMLNILNPNIFRISSFKLSENIMGSFSVNYSLTPFGDFVEQNAYLTIRSKLKINPYLRQYFNKSSVFSAGGINLKNYCLNDKFLLNSSFDFWAQPKNLEFRTKLSDFGFGLKSDIAYKFTRISSGDFYFNIGASYKTFGFIPESPSLKEDLRLNAGFVYSVLKN